ncbi:hypothetical protein [Psychrobacter sp. DM8]|uniref:hypothetical protein n=1 Tax=Psychrobacter sp. DM8 TaxID=3440636 RepID=UPI003F50576F
MIRLYKPSLLIAVPVLSMAMTACQSNLPTNNLPTNKAAIQSTTTNKAAIQSTNSAKASATSIDVSSTSVIDNTNADDALNNSAEPKAPWTSPAITISDTDAIYHQEWLKSENRSVCPILALPKQAEAHIARHSVRRARFSGGWGVAYDLPNTRSMYGVANTGVINPSEAAYDWPYNIYYTDGSKVGYGHEGGDPTASWLAYVVTPNNCMYNVWSAQDKAHLEQMIADLRMVNANQ